MNDLDFNRAVQVAGASIGTLVRGALNPVLEEAMISADGKLYEITFSYDLNNAASSEDTAADNISRLAALMARRREYKTFLVDAEDFGFRGFRAYKEHP